MTDPRSPHENVSFDPQQFYACHKARIDQAGNELATDYDTPAQRIINRAFADMNTPRFAAGDDRWEMIQSHLNGWEYVKPSQDLISRWARY